MSQPPPIYTPKLTFRQALHLLNIEPTLKEKRAYIKHLRKTELITADTRLELLATLEGKSNQEGTQLWRLIFTN